jgi:hypothetical protein
MIELLTSLNKGPFLDRLIWRANLSLLNAGPDCIAIVSVDRGPRSLAKALEPSSNKSSQLSCVPSSMPQAPLHVGANPTFEPTIAE